MIRPPLFYLSADARSAFWILLGVNFSAEFLIALFMRAGRGDRTDDRGSLFWFVTLLPASWAGAFMLAGAPWGFFGNIPVYRAGLVLIGAGMWLRWWSVATLGRLFTVNVAIRTKHRLVDSGPYHYVRHPSYTAVLLVQVGAALCLGSVLSLFVMTVPLLATLLNRMRVEENVLVAGLGQAYRDYMTRTKRLVPAIY